LFQILSFLFQARVAELEGENTKLEEEIAGMKELLSVQEHDHRRIFQDLSKVT